MRTNSNDSAARPRSTRAGIAAGLLACFLCSGFNDPKKPAADDGVADLWKDPVFQKQFVAGYGVNAEIEPRVTPEEVKVLEKIRPAMADNLPAAEAQLLKLMKGDCSAMLDFTLGSIRYQQEKTGLALESYRKAVEKFPSFRRAWRNLGLIHAREGHNQEAIAAFTRMVELGGGDGYSYGLLGYSYAAVEDYQAAEVAYRTALLLQPETVEWRFGLTRCAFKQEKFQDAVALLDVLLERYPERGDFWWLQANALLGLKQPLRAAENLEMMHFLGKSTVESLFALGDIYVTENLNQLALRAYLAGIDANPEQSFARPLRSAEVLTARGALSEAQGLVEKVRAVWAGKLDESDQRRLLKLDARIGLAQGDTGGNVVLVLLEIVRLDPLDGEALMLLGQHYAGTNEPDRAMFYYERAAGIEAYEVNARVRHAQVLVDLERFADAIPLLRRAQELKPREDVARYLEQVERIARTRR